MTLQYRRDIDGLRSLAIIPVVLFHLGMLHWFGGGFLGVDVFFVISGFLITKILNDDLNRGQFSILRFYERRIRRIFPALFTILLFCLCAGFFVLLPKEFTALGDMVVATTLFASNIWLFFHENYFGKGAERDLLLHTWSLAVEEQFYLVFPLLLAVLYRAGHRAKLTALWLLAISSLGVNIWMLRNDPAAAFYLPMPRAWELLLGSVLALDAVPTIGIGWVRDAFGFVGVGLIAASVVFLDDQTKFMLPIALVPCIGAGMLIMAGASIGSIMTRLLSNPVLVYVGKISYSLYLWHLPLVALYRPLVREDLETVDRIILVLVSVALAAISTRFIERPFRLRASADIKPTTKVFVFGGATMAAAIACGVVVIASGGMASRFPPEIVRLGSYLAYDDVASFRTDSCFLSTNSNDFHRFRSDLCLAPATDRPNLLLIGDSHAAHLWSGLAAEFPDLNVMQATVAQCLPLLNAAPDGPFDKACRDMMEEMLLHYIHDHRLDGVILAGHWAKENVVPLIETVRYVRQFVPNIYVVGPIIEYSQPLPRILAVAALDHRAGLAEQLRLKEPFSLDLMMKAALSETGTHYVSMVGTMCDGRDCLTTTPEGAPVQFDYGHLTEAGSRLVAARWRGDGVFDAVTSAERH
jgi:peptidoglycan/LPS O-acetylase OafA/YrhL